MDRKGVMDLLPVGSVVLLKDGQKPLMIYGVRQADAEEPEREYDYLAVLYPEGYFSEKMKFLFDREGIEKVLFTGYESPERQEFLGKLAEYYEKNEGNE